MERQVPHGTTSRKGSSGSRQAAQLIHHLFLHPFTVSSGRAQGGPALAAFWARVREATGSSSGAAAAAAFFIAALDAFAARGKACGETCVEGGSPSTSVQSASVALSTCPGPALSTPRATWWKGSFPSGVVSACFHDTVCERVLLLPISSWAG